MAKDVFATLNYSKMHITVNANKNTKLTPIALNIVYSPPRVAWYALLGYFFMWSRFNSLYASYYTTFLYFVYSILQNFSEICVTPWRFKKTNVYQYNLYRYKQPELFVAWFLIIIQLYTEIVFLMAINHPRVSGLGLSSRGNVETLARRGWS